MTRRLCFIALLLTSLAFSLPIQAQTLRWAARSDARSMDPQAALEGNTISINALAYDGLVELDRHDRIVPALATGWQIVEPTLWRFTLRRDVKFQDGTPFTASDVVFSIERAQQSKSAFASYALPMGKVKRIDDHTIELRQERPNPILLNQLALLLMMSRDWCLAHDAALPPDPRQKDEGFSNRFAMGTGRYQLTHYEPGVRTELTRNPHWWGRFEGNVQQVVFTPIGNDVARSAALLAGDVDLLQDVPVQDMARLAREPSLHLFEGTENRLIFFGMDQASDELVYASVKGRNPFKDVRVREAFFRAIDVASLRRTIMQGRAQTTACMSVSAASCFAPAALAHPPADLARARQLMAEAGYAAGFDLKLDCPNDRYINDEALCVALAPMLARIGVRLKVDATSLTQFFPKLDAHDTSFFMQGYGYSPDDPQLLFEPVLHSVDEVGRKGGDNIGRFHDGVLDGLIDAAAAEMDVPRRERLMGDIQQRVFDNFYELPIHRQGLTWAARKNVQAVLTSNNRVRVDWVRID